MQLRKILSFYSGVNYLHFLLLYDIALLGNWLQTFREKVGLSFQKAKTTKTILLFENKSQFFIEKFGKPLPNEEEL
jgi:hypothetical protein